MNQFTSHIDFNLTRKRFLMMKKQFSVFKSFSKSLLLICFVCVISLLFCTNTENHPDELYTDVTLHSSNLFLESNTIPAYKETIMLAQSGEPFTGVQSYYFKKNDQLFMTFTFREGIRIKEQVFEADGTEKYRKDTDFDFEVNQRLNVRVYDEGALTIEIIDSSPEHDGLHLYREWHTNGQLKFENTSNELGSNGLMTLYDVDGNIIEQELYKNGQLVEKIK